MIMLVDRYTITILVKHYVECNTKLEIKTLLPSIRVVLRELYFIDQHFQMLRFLTTIGYLFSPQFFQVSLTLCMMCNSS